MAKSFDELANKVMSKGARQRAKERSVEIMTELFLKEIRQIMGLSQADLAARLGIKQPTLSRLESQDQDMQIETLRRIVQALGGELDVVARFPKGTVRLSQFSDKTQRRRGESREPPMQELQLA